MRSVASPRVATCVVVAAFASAPAVILPSNARADSGTAAADPIAAVVQATGIDVALPTEGDAAAATDAALTTALDSGLPDAAADVAGAPDPAPETADPAPSATKAPDPASPVVERVSAPDTTAGAADTTADTVASQAAPTPPPVAVQATPTNVNVSVRIASGGDNGPVTQTNVAAVASTAAIAAPPKPAATASTTSLSANGTDAATPAHTTMPAAAAQDDEGTWSWQWDCVSVPAISTISPGGSGVGSTPKNWTWIWNCGDNSTQYHGATVDQYQPTNVNVSIRIASPGNDGPVSQANIAFAVSAGGSVPHGAATSGASGSSATVPVPVAMPVVALPAIPGVSELPGLPAVLSPVLPSLPPALESSVAALVGPEAAPLLGELDGLSLVAPPALEPDAVSLLAGGTGRLSTFRPGRSAVPQASLVRPTVLTESAITTAIPVAEHAGPTTKAAGARAKPAPRWRTPAPTVPAPAQAPPGASAAAAGGGGSSGGGLPFFLALPFVAAMLDLARRAALDRVATPSGQRSRIPDDPG